MRRFHVFQSVALSPLSRFSLSRRRRLLLATCYPKAQFSSNDSDSSDGHGKSGKKSSIGDLKSLFADVDAEEKPDSKVDLASLFSNDNSNKKKSSLFDSLFQDSPQEAKSTESMEQSLSDLLANFRQPESAGTKDFGASFSEVLKGIRSQGGKQAQPSYDTSSTGETTRFLIPERTGAPGKQEIDFSAFPRVGEGRIKRRSRLRDGRRADDSFSLEGQGSSGQLRIRDLVARQARKSRSSQFDLSPEDKEFFKELDKQTGALRAQEDRRGRKKLDSNTEDIHRAVSSMYLLFDHAADLCDRKMRAYDDFVQKLTEALESEAQRKKKKRARKQVHFSRWIEKLLEKRRAAGLPLKPPPKWTREQNYRVSLDGREFLEDCKIPKDHPYYSVLENVARAITLNPSWDYVHKRRAIQSVKQQLEWAEKQTTLWKHPSRLPREEKFLYWPTS